MAGTQLCRYNRNTARGMSESPIERRDQYFLFFVQKQKVFSILAQITKIRLVLWNTTYKPWILNLERFVMAKRKLKRFADVETFDNVAKPTMEEAMSDSFALKGKWNSDYFNNENPIVLELACGKGEYTIGLAKNYPNKNFIGIDIKGARLWAGAKYATENKMSNVGFIRTRIDFITCLFGPQEVSEIWITFADPQPQKNRARKRLTGNRFLDRYRIIMKSGGKVNLKSDSDFLYEFTKEVVAEGNLKVEVDSANIYEELVPTLGDAPLAKDLLIRTYYEQRWLNEGKKIKFISFVP